jgi:hypothetical protein
MDNLKENWKIYLLMTFISAMFAFAGAITASGYINKEAKIENAASTIYVDTKHNIAIKHTDDEIRKHAENENDKIERLEKYFDNKFEAFSKTQDNRFDDLKDYIKLIKE